MRWAKSREINAEMQFKTPKMHRSEFRNTLLYYHMDLRITSGAKQGTGPLEPVP